MDKFYCLKLILPDGTRGYVADTPKGIQVVSADYAASITQFATYPAAQEFMRSRKLERGGVKAYIRDNTDLMKEIKELKSENIVQVGDNDTVYYIENSQGQKVFYDDSKESYYFDNRNSGYCCWFNDKQVQEFLDFFPVKDLVVKKFETKEKKNEAAN